MAKDYYEILGVNENTSAEDIKKAYRELAKKYHPDANRGNKDAENRFKEISEAYNVISDPEKRKKYDQMRKFGGLGGDFDFNSFDLNDLGKFWQGSKTNRKRGGGFSIEDLFGSGGFGLGDIFGDIFDRGGNMRREKWGGKQNGESLHSELTIPFELSINGGRQVINITREEKCGACNGTGARRGTKPKTCPTCNGVGTISMSQGFFSVNRPCPNCYGRGHIIKDICRVCNGAGETRVSKKLAITIPAGIEDGAKLKLSGQGKTGIKGGATGDIIVTIRVKQHKFFKRNGNDISCQIPIDIIKAIKGTKIRLKTVYGKMIEVKIPPGTTDNKTFKLKNMGVISKKRTGDLYIIVKIKKRSNLNAEERKIVEEYENLNR